MTPDDTLERHLVASMASVAASGFPDYLDDILGRSSRTRQRRARVPWQRSAFPTGAPRQHGGGWTWRSLMTPILGVSAAVLLVAAFGAWFGPHDPSTQYGAADPTPSVSPSSSPTPVRLPDGPLPAGTYVALPFAAPGSGACYSPPQPGCSDPVADDGIRFTLTVPDGLLGGADYSVGLDVGERNTPAWAAVLLERGALLYPDPCAAPEVADMIPVGQTAAEFADALVAHPSLDVTTPVDVTLAGYSGKYLELQVPLDLAGCDAYRPWEPGIFARWPGERWFLWVLDVDGIRVIVRKMVHEGTTPEVLAKLQGVIDSIAIEPATAPVASPSPAALTYSSASLEQDWPAAVRGEPAGDPIVVSWDSDHTDARGDIESLDVPWVDIVSVRHLPCTQLGVCVEFGASVPTGPDEPSWNAYGLVFDEDLDGVADVRLGTHKVPAERARTFGDTDGGTWRTDLRTGVTESSESDRSICDCFGLFGTMRHFYPGQASASERFPGRFYAWASVIQDGRVVATDYAPDTGWLDPVRSEGAASPLVSPSPAPLVRGWPASNPSRNPAGVYSWIPGTSPSGCALCTGRLGWMHNYNATGNVEIIFGTWDRDTPSSIRTESSGPQDIEAMRSLVAAAGYDDQTFRERPVRVPDDRPVGSAESRTQMWLLDVDGTRFFMLVAATAGTSAAEEAEAEAIVRSVRLGPPGLGPGIVLTFEMPPGWDSG